jgi:predicted secreted protein
VAFRKDYHVRQCDTARVSSDARRDVVELRVGEQHPIRLAGLGTAGYRWEPLVEGDEGVAEVSDAGVARPANARIGTSADELFTIRAVRPGVTRVRFVQRRPWESEDEPAANEHVVEIRVT